MTDEADRVPTTPNGYKPQIEKRPGLPDNVQIDTAHPRYRAHLEAAHRAGLSQRQFSAMLTSEVEVFARAQAEAQKKAAKTALEVLAVANGPYRHTARLTLGAIAIGAKDFTGAGKWLDQVVADPDAPASDRRNAETLLGVVASNAPAAK